MTAHVVAITGAGRGIGRGLALAFARSGARAVVVSDIDLAAADGVADEVRGLGCDALALQVDVTSADDCTALVDAACEAYGRIDVAICNAGITLVRSLLDLQGEDFDRTLAVNVKGAFLTLQAAARRMLLQPPPAPGRPRGKILTMASIAGRSGAGPIAAVLAPYRASKAALLSLTQSAAVALAPAITVNAICPGLVDTEMWKQIDGAWTTLQGLPAGQAWQQRVAAVPMGRAQQPEDVAGLALYLASPAADYMTGQAINIDGGLVMN
jgi:NAD(P)-dependent dehydrogenase (short-subunit alcohol dehydrogenase family)